MISMPEWVTQGILNVEKERNEPVVLVIPTRYPFTYAYDYIRSHAAAFDLTPREGEACLSRMDITRVLRKRLGVGSDHPYYRAVCAYLADEYIREHQLVWDRQATI